MPVNLIKVPPGSRVRIEEADSGSVVFDGVATDGRIVMDVAGSYLMSVSSEETVLKKEFTIGDLDEIEDAKNMAFPATMTTRGTLYSCRFPECGFTSRSKMKMYAHRTEHGLKNEPKKARKSKNAAPPKVEIEEVKGS